MIDQLFEKISLPLLVVLDMFVLSRNRE